MKPSSNLVYLTFFVAALTLLTSVAAKPLPLPFPPIPIPVPESVLTKAVQVHAKRRFRAKGPQASGYISHPQDIILNSDGTLSQTVRYRNPKSNEEWEHHFTTRLEKNWLGQHKVGMREKYTLADPSTKQVVPGRTEYYHWKDHFSTGPAHHHVYQSWKSPHWWSPFG